MRDEHGVPRSELRALLGDRRVRVGRLAADFVGKTRVYVSEREGGVRRSFHADKHCGNFPRGAVRVFPVTFARDAYHLKPCSECTTGGAE